YFLPHENRQNQSHQGYCGQYTMIHLSLPFLSIHTQEKFYEQFLFLFRFLLRFLFLHVQPLGKYNHPFPYFVREIQYLSSLCFHVKALLIFCKIKKPQSPEVPLSSHYSTVFCLTLVLTLNSIGNFLFSLLPLWKKNRFFLFQLIFFASTH